MILAADTGPAAALAAGRRHGRRRSRRRPPRSSPRPPHRRTDRRGADARRRVRPAADRAADVPARRPCSPSRSRRCRSRPPRSSTRPLDAPLDDVHGHNVDVFEELARLPEPVPLGDPSAPLPDLLAPQDPFADPLRRRARDRAARGRGRARRHRDARRRWSTRRRPRAGRRGTRPTHPRSTWPCARAPRRGTSASRRSSPSRQPAATPRDLGDRPLAAAGSAEGTDGATDRVLGGHRRLDARQRTDDGRVAGDADANGATELVDPVGDAVVDGPAPSRW